MRFDVLTIFPEMFEGPMHASILQRAQDQKIINCQLYDFRKFTENKHGKVDDTPYGGGAGMVLAPQPIVDAWKSISKVEKTRTIMLTPIGKLFDYAKAVELAQYDQLILICGHYEGIDQRVSELLVDEHLSIGDYV
ncbi:MAG: tRNA (guanosine(37)-N1)-methyltransferase TrmD, partial [Clostridia bacterium]